MLVQLFEGSVRVLLDCATLAIDCVMVAKSDPTMGKNRDIALFQVHMRTRIALFPNFLTCLYVKTDVDGKYSKQD